MAFDIYLTLLRAQAGDTPLARAVQLGHAECAAALIAAGANCIARDNVRCGPLGTTRVF